MNMNNETVYNDGDGYLDSELPQYYSDNDTDDDTDEDSPTDESNCSLSMFQSPSRARSSPISKRTIPLLYSPLIDPEDMNQFTTTAESSQSSHPNRIPLSSSSSSLHSAPIDTPIIQHPKPQPHPTHLLPLHTLQLHDHTTRWEYQSTLAKSHAQPATVLDVSGRVVCPGSLVVGVPPAVAVGVEDFRFDLGGYGNDEEYDEEYGNYDEYENDHDGEGRKKYGLPEFLDVCGRLFPNLKHLTFTKQTQPQDGIGYNDADAAVAEDGDGDGEEIHVEEYENDTNRVQRKQNEPIQTGSDFFDAMDEYSDPKSDVNIHTDTDDDDDDEDDDEVLMYNENGEQIHTPHPNLSPSTRNITNPNLHTLLSSLDTNTNLQHAKHHKDQTQIQIQRGGGESTSSTRMQRLYVLYRLPDLVSIDGVVVTEEERKLARPCTPTGYKVHCRDWLTCNNSANLLPSLDHGGISGTVGGTEEGGEGDILAYYCSEEDFGASASSREDGRNESYEIRLDTNGDMAIQPATPTEISHHDDSYRGSSGTGSSSSRRGTAASADESSCVVVPRETSISFLTPRDEGLPRNTTMDAVMEAKDDTTIFPIAPSSGIRNTIQHPPALTYSGNENGNETTTHNSSTIGFGDTLITVDNHNPNSCSFLDHNTTTGKQEDDPTVQDSAHMRSILEDSTSPFPLHRNTTRTATATTTAISKAFSLFPHTGRAIAACPELSLLPEHRTSMSKLMPKTMVNKAQLITDNNNNNNTNSDNDSKGSTTTKHRVATSTTTTTGGLVAHNATTDYMEMHCLSTCPNIDGSVTYPATTNNPTPLLPTNSSASTPSSTLVSPSTSKKEDQANVPLLSSVYINEDSGSTRQQKISIPSQPTTTTAGGANSKSWPIKKNLDSFFMAKRTKSRGGTSSNQHHTHSGTAQNHPIQGALSEATDIAISGQILSKCFPKSSLSSPFPIQFRDGNNTSNSNTPHNGTTTGRSNHLDGSTEKENDKPTLDFTDLTRLQSVRSSSLPRSLLARPSSSSLHKIDNCKAIHDTKKEGNHRRKGEKKKMEIMDVIPTMVNVRLKKGKKKGGLHRPPPSPASVMRTFPQSRKKKQSSKRRFISPFSKRRKDLEPQMTNSVMDQLDEEDEDDGTDGDEEDGDDNSELDIYSKQVLVRGSG